MKDFKIRHIGSGVYDLELDDDGDLVEVEGDEETINHLTYRLHTWLGESPYDRSEGFPYIGGVFGNQPLEGIAGLFQVYIGQTRGVRSIRPIPSIDLDDDATVRLAPVVFLDGGNPVTVPVEVSS
jgi:hypothetical protein